MVNRVYLDRDEKLYPCMLGKSFQVYNGKKYERLEVVRLRVGMKAGQFIRTRKFPVHKKKERYH